MSNLSEYIASKGMTRSEFAKTVGISAPYLSEILSGAKRPSLNLAFRIEGITGGEVPASGWVEHSYSPLTASSKEAE